MTLQAIKYQNGRLEILNQLLLPQKSIYEELRGTEDGWQAIRQMKVGLMTRALCRIGRWKIECTTPSIPCFAANTDQDKYTPPHCFFVLQKHRKCI